MTTIKVQTLGLNSKIPTRGSICAAGLDLYAKLIVPFIYLKPGERALIKTGIAVQIPTNTVGLVCPRSGLADKYGITVLNAPGIIDEDFRGEIGVIVVNLSQVDYRINNGDRIAQLVIVPTVLANVIEVETLDATSRSGNGFGSTGK